jgi:two-component system nitrate/nitrite response regulator NarL
MSVPPATTAAADTPAAPIRLMVVDDHTLFRRGLIALLTSDGRFEVVGEAGDAAQALQVLRACRPQVLLLDHHLPGASGVDVLPSLLEAQPGLRVLMLTMSEDEHDLAAALQRGASGYLLKSADIDELGAAIVRALAGQSSVSAPMTAKLASAFRLAGAPASPAAAGAAGAAGAADAAAAASLPAERRAEDAGAERALESLSARERQTLELIARGDSNKEIARALGIAEATVKIHVQHILRKLGLASRVQAATLLVSLEPAGRQAAEPQRR